MRLDEFVVDIESKGEHRGDPHRNDVFWVSLAGPGRADAIPCGHPLGERIIRDPNDGFYRVDPRTGKHQEHRINETTGRPKWVNVPEPFEEPPAQLWVSDVMRELRPLFFSGKTVVGQNVKFDVESLTKYFGETPPGPFADTLVAAKLINENYREGYSLGKLVKREFGFEYEKIGKKGPENFPYSEAYLYSYLDAKYTWLLWQKYKQQMDETERSVFDMEMQLLPVIIDMEQAGMPIDEDALERLGDEFAAEMADIQVAMNKVAGTEINLNANRQVATLVYETLGHSCTTFTPTGDRSASRETLEEFSDDPAVAMLLDHAALRKLQSTFINGLKTANHEGRVHPSLNQVGTVSGRLSCSSPNLQQIPSRSERGKKVREVFVASPGHSLVVSDLSQIELRMLAHFTQDPVLMKAYQDGVDLHGAMAERVFGLEYTPLQRTLAKNSHFAALYGAGPNTLVRRYQVPNVKVAKELLKGFYGTYRTVEPWKETVIADARSKWKRKTTPPYVTTILGRKRRLPELMSRDENERFAAERQAVSVTISGSAADLFKLIMIQTWHALQDEAIGAKMLMTVHDELIVEVPETSAETCLEIVRTEMENVYDDDGEPVLTVPILADAKIVQRWSDAK